MKHLSKIFIFFALQLLFTACPYEEFASNPYLCVYNKTQDSLYIWKEDVFLNNRRSIPVDLLFLPPQQETAFVYYDDDSWEQVFSINKQESIREIHIYISKESAGYESWLKEHNDTTCFEKEIVLTSDDFSNDKDLRHTVTIE